MRGYFLLGGSGSQQAGSGAASCGSAGLPRSTLKTRQRLVFHDGGKGEHSGSEVVGVKL